MPSSTIADLFVDACIRDEDSELLFLSLFGRDTSMLQFLCRFLAQAQRGRFASKAIRPCSPLLDDERPTSVFVRDPGGLDKLTGRLPQRNLFGNLTPHLAVSAESHEP